MRISLKISRLNIHKTSRLLVSVLCLFILVVGICQPVHAENLDEIEKYEITADVNDDATVNLKYHIEWRVLDSESEGPLEWVKIGLPNSHIENLEALTDNIDSIDYDEDGGTFANIYFDREYEEGEVVTFEFSLVQDYLYQMNRDEEGYTVYNLTPGWFNSIVVDQMTIRWNADKVSSWTPECLVDDGYNTWETSLDEGEKLTINVTYPNDAFAFNEEVSDRYEETYYDDDWEDDYYDDYYDDDDAVESFFFLFFVVIVIGGNIANAMMGNSQYDSGSGFGEKPETKITRTKVVYHTNCPNCGAPRAEGKDACEYCGTNLIKSEEILKEETISKEDKKKYSKDGEFSYGSIPDTYIRVHTVVVPHVHTSGPRGGHRGGGCAHSSCACACASCACACACACAGGGRAGCSNKDFYKKSLKLAMLKKKCEK